MWFSSKCLCSSLSGVARSQMTVVLKISCDFKTITSVLLKFGFNADFVRRSEQFLSS